jgi:hypothetical protein
MDINVGKEGKKRRELKSFRGNTPMKKKRKPYP